MTIGDYSNNPEATIYFQRIGYGKKKKLYSGKQRWKQMKKQSQKKSKKGLKD